MSSSPLKSQPLVESFKAFYRDLSEFRLDDLASIYDAEVLFKDPVHQLRGICTLHSYLTELCTNVDHCRFEYLDQLIGDNRAYIKWNMFFSHRRLGSQLITVRGITQLEFTERVFYHEDVYDMGQLLYDHLPLLGAGTRFLKRRMARSVEVPSAS